MLIFGHELISVSKYLLKVVAERTRLAEYHRAETNFIYTNRMNPSQMGRCGFFHLDKTIIVDIRNIY